MKKLSSLLAMLLVSSQVFAVTKVEEIKLKIDKVQSEIDRIQTARLKGTSITASAGKQILVVTGTAASYFLAKGRGFNKFNSAGAAAAFTALGESAVVIIDSEILEESINQKRGQIAIMNDQMAKLVKAGQGSEEVSKLVSANRSAIEKRVSDLAAEIESLEQARSFGSLFSNSAGKHLAVVAATAAATLISKGNGANTSKTIGTMLAAITAGEGLVVYIDIKAVDSAINDLNFELNDLRSQLQEAQK